MSALLLDIDSALWWLNDDRRLGAEARRLIMTREMFVSVVSLWEIALKHGLSKLATGP